MRDFISVVYFFGRTIDINYSTIFSQEHFRLHEWRKNLKFSVSKMATSEVQTVNNFHLLLQAGKWIVICSFFTDMVY